MLTRSLGSALVTDWTIISLREAGAYLSGKLTYDYCSPHQWRPRSSEWYLGAVPSDCGWDWSDRGRLQERLVLSISGEPCILAGPQGNLQIGFPKASLCCIFRKEASDDLTCAATSAGRGVSMEFAARRTKYKLWIVHQKCTPRS